MTTQDNKEQRARSPQRPVSNHLKNQISAQELSDCLYKARDQRQHYQIQSQLNYSQIQFPLSYQYNNSCNNYQSNIQSFSMQGLDSQNNILRQQSCLIPANQQQLGSILLPYNINQIDTLIYYNQNQRRSSLNFNSKTSVQQQMIVKNTSDKKEEGQAGHDSAKVRDARQQNNRDQCFKIKDTESYSYYTDKINIKESSQIYFVSSGDSKLSHNLGSFQNIDRIVAKNSYESNSSAKKGEVGSRLKKIKCKNNSTHTANKAHSPHLRMLSQIFSNTEVSNPQFAWDKCRNNKNIFLHKKNKRQISKFSLQDELVSRQQNQNLRTLASQQLQKKCQNQLDTTLLQFSPRPTNLMQSAQKITHHNSISLEKTDSKYQNVRSRDFNCVNKQKDSPSPRFHQQRNITQKMDRCFTCVKTVDLGLYSKPIANLTSIGDQNNQDQIYSSINSIHRNVIEFSPLTNLYSQNSSPQSKVLNQTLQSPINIRNIVESARQREGNSYKKTKILQISKILGKELQNYSKSASKQNKKIIKLNSISKITKIKPFNPENIGDNYSNMLQQKENKSIHSSFSKIKQLNKQHANQLSRQDSKSGKKTKKLSVTSTKSHLYKQNNILSSDRPVKNSNQIHPNSVYIKQINLQTQHQQMFRSRQLLTLPANMNGLIKKVDQYKNGKVTKYQQLSRGCLSQRNKNNRLTQIKTDSNYNEHDRRNIRSIDLIPKPKFSSYIAPIQQVVAKARTTNNSQHISGYNSNNIYNNPKINPILDSARTTQAYHYSNPIINNTHNHNLISKSSMHVGHIDFDYGQIANTVNPENIAYMNTFLMVNNYPQSTQPYQQTHSIYTTSPAY